MGLMRRARNARPPSSQSHPDPLMNGYCFPTTTFEIENQEEAAASTANNERAIASDRAGERTSLAVILLVDRDRSGGGGGQGSEPDRAGLGCNISPYLLRAAGGSGSTGPVRGLVRSQGGMQGGEKKVRSNYCQASAPCGNRSSDRENLQ